MQKIPKKLNVCKISLNILTIKIFNFLGIHGVDIRLKKQISDNHEQLLVHCVDVGNIEQHLINVQKKMQAIRERVFNLQQKVSIYL